MLKMASRARLMVQLALENYTSDKTCESESSKPEPSRDVTNCCSKEKDTSLSESDTNDINIKIHTGFDVVRSLRDKGQLKTTTNNKDDTDYGEIERSDSELEDSLLADFDDDFRDKEWLPDKRKRHYSSDSSSDDDLRSARKSDKVVKQKSKSKGQPSVDINNNVNLNTTNPSDETNNVLVSSDAGEVLETIPDVIDHEEVISFMENNSEEQATNEKGTKAKKGKGDPKSWTKNKNKILRMEGRSYKGVGKEFEGAKKSHCVERNERILTAPNCGNRCKKARQCHQISAETRQDIFQAFWRNMNWDQKKVYVTGLVDRSEKAQCTVSDGKQSRRSITYRYHLRDEENRVPVCKDLFLSTLGIGEFTLYSWMNQVNNQGIPASPSANTPAHQENEDKPEPERVQNARQYLSELPKMESHYCRQSTSKLYIEPIFRSFSDLYRAYKCNCDEWGIPNTVSRQKLLSLFNDMNMSLFRPKKDQCDLCVAHEMKNVSDEEYQAHIGRKVLARNEKDTDKQIASDNSKVKVLTMDTQAVLLCPSLQASAVYFKTKLACHNFTTYNLISREVCCYFWHEGEGGLIANNFVSCIVNKLEDILSPDVEEVILYSDGCCYQNRNVTLANALVHTAVKHGVTVTQKYLERGHTQMEVDSVHSTIERKLRKVPIYSPTNYVEQLSMARPNHPYKVLYLTHDFFKDYSELKYYDTIRPGKRVGDPVVTDIRVVRYLPNGTVLYKLRFDEEFKELAKPRNFREPQDLCNVGRLYSRPLQIKKTKFDHLQQLKSYIPRD